MSSMHAALHVVELALHTFAKSNTSAFGMYVWPQPFDDTPPTFVGKPIGPRTQQRLNWLRERYGR